MATRTINQYRFLCGTESTYKYVWAESQPTTCPTASNHTIDLNSLTIVDSISQNSTALTDINRDPYGDIRIVQKTSCIELKSCFGLSKLRDIAITSGTGTVTNTPGDSEYKLRAVGPNSVATLKSAERGRYVSGYGAEAGIGIRLGATLNSDVTAMWGLYDGTDGFIYRVTGSNIEIVIRRNGVETVFPRSVWNVDRVDGSGPSGITLDLTKGNVFNIQFSWYGYGIIDFRVVATNKHNEQRFVSLHRYTPLTNTSVQNPNLPIYAGLTHNNLLSALTTSDLFVAGRQYSIIGQYKALKRINCAYVTNFSVSSTTIFLPVLSIRRKAGYLGNGVRIVSADLLPTSTNQIIQVRVGGTLNNTIFTNINDQLVEETCIEMNTTATTITGGFVIWTGIIASTRNNSTFIDTIDYDLTEDSILTLCAKGIGQTNGTFAGAMRWTEEW